MRAVTEKEIMEALADHATPEDHGIGPGWRFARSGVWHTEAESREVVRICLTMQQPVSGVLTSALFGAVVTELADLHDMIRRMHT